MTCVLSNSPTAQSPQFGTRTDAVYLDVTVSDSKGHIIGGLMRDDFEVFDEGERQDVAVFSSDPAPVSIAVLVDVSRSMTGNRLTAARRAVMALGRSMRAGDQWSVYTFSERLTRLFDWESFSETRVETLAKITAGGGTELFRSVTEVVPHTRGAAHRKRALWVLTDGADSARQSPKGSDLSGGSSAGLEVVGGPIDSSARALAALRSGEVLAYALGLNWRPAAGVQSALNLASLRQIAEPTGGAVAVAESIDDVENAARSLGDELRVQYTVGFYPLAKPDGRFHRLRVIAKNPEYQVRTRLGYLSRRQ